MCTEIEYEEMPTAVLPNGLVVGNFSSNHEFYLKDSQGDETALRACTEARSKALQLDTAELRKNRGKWTDLKGTFSIPERVLKELERVQEDPAVDVILVSWPTMNAWKKLGRDVGKLRSGKWKDRQEKRIYADRFYC